MKLRTGGSDSDAAPEFERIISFMQGGVSLDGDLLRTKIAELDQRRGQDLRAVEPEFADIIEYGGPDG
jgi:hypothetical protein